MREKQLIAILLSGILLLSACGRESTLKEQERDTEVQSYAIDGLKEFCITEGGFYCLRKENETITRYAFDGTVTDSWLMDADTEEAELFGFVGEPPADAMDLSGLCRMGERLYSYRILKGTVMELDTESGTQRICGRLPDGSMIEKAAAGETSILYSMISMNGNGAKTAVLLIPQSGELRYLETEGLIAVSACGGDCYWLEVKTVDGEIYFQQYDAVTDSYSEKYLASLADELIDFGYCMESGQVVGFDYFQCLSLNPKQPQAAARFNPDMNHPGTNIILTQFDGKRIYLQDEIGGLIYSFIPEEFTRQNRPLKGYVLDLSDVPDWSGYQIELVELSWEEMALKALAGDSDYDFLVMSTELTQAASVRDAYCYYPLPEDRIARYLDECFPYLREAATHDGSVWMLPLRLYASGIVYHEENMARYGYDMEAVGSYREFSEIARTLYESGESGHYEIAAMPTDRLLQEYLRLEQRNQDGEISFDTDRFREVLDFLTGDYGSGEPFRYSWMDVNTFDYSNLREENPELSFRELDRIRWEIFLNTTYFQEVLNSVVWEYEKYVGLDGFHVRSVPTLFGEELPNAIAADILIVNPNSDHLEAALDFVETMAASYIEDPACHLSAMEDIYPQDTFSRDLYRLYRDGEVIFPLPRELFTEYHAFLMGQTDDREALIETLNRKLNMYLHE